MLQVKGMHQSLNGKEHSKKYFEDCPERVLWNAIEPLGTHIFYSVRAEGEARVLKASTQGAYLRAGVLGASFWKARCSQRRFPAISEAERHTHKMYKEKPYVVIKKQFSRATKGLSQDGDEIFGLS
jgi:hypothetical protein